MKSIFSVFGCLVFFCSFLVASPIINTEDHPMGQVDMCELIPDHKFMRSEVKERKVNEQRLSRFENLLEKITKRSNAGKSNRALGGLSDPVDKWFWIWIIAWGAGIVITVASGGALTGAAIGIIWLAAFGLGSVALVLWLVKKFG